MSKLTNILKIRDKVKKKSRQKMNVLNVYSRKKMHIYFPNEWPGIKSQLSQKKKIDCQDLF